MSLALAERILFPAGRGFVPFPIRRSVLRLLERRATPDSALARSVYRQPPDPEAPPRAWLAANGQTWLRLESALTGSGAPVSAQDWLALNGPLESPAEVTFVSDVFAPVLGERGLRSLHAQEVFSLPGGGIGRIDFVVILNDVRVAIEVDGIEHHEGVGPDGRRPERERDRQNALISAGYVVLRFTGRDVVTKPAETRRKLRGHLATLGLLEPVGSSDDTQPLPISPTAHALLGSWPRQFVRTQQAMLDHIKCASEDWLSKPTLRVLIPRTEHGAVVLGVVDALDAVCTAQRMSGRAPSLTRIEVWIGDHRDTVLPLIEDRVKGASAPQLPFELALVTQEPPSSADLLFVTPTDDFTDDELVGLLGGLSTDATVVWCTDVDAPAAKVKAGRPAYFQNPVREHIEHLLERFFGFTSFRAGQWEIVERLLQGRSTLGVLPTGAGKTVCFQLPALLQPGVTLVVSPLVSLMDDQVMNLRAIGLDFAGRVHSRVPDDERTEELRRFSAGSYKLFYVSPERFHSREFVRQLHELTGEDGQPIPYFVVDEAHLASEWGHDFRPSYLTLPDAHTAICPQTPIALLTATAPRQIRDDLTKIFGRVANIEAVLPPTFDRPELSFEVRRVGSDDERKKAVFDLVRRDLPQSLGYRDFEDLHAISSDRDQVAHGGLIFTPWGKPGDFRLPIRSANLAAALRKAGVKAVDYRTSTAESEVNDRAALNRHTQERFKRNEVPLVVATKGFGTGIDKPDIRYVVHADMPGSLEALYQEAGRAGRDGRDARAAMVWRPRPDECRPQKGPPACAVLAKGKCPHELTEQCSFGVQANLKAGNQAGAVADIETSRTLWRRYFRNARDGDVRLPRSLKVDAVTRQEVLGQTQDILQRLHQLGLCGAPSVPTEPEKPLFVKTRPFSRDVLVQRVQAVNPGVEEPRGTSDEAFLTNAIRLAFGLSDAEAHGHTAVWAMYLRHRQLLSKWTPVPRTSSTSGQTTQRPDVERFLARLVRLGVVRSYRFHRLNAWSVERVPMEERTTSALANKLVDALTAHGGIEPAREPLSSDWSEAVEQALTRLIQSWYETIAVRSWETLESLEEYARATDCRRRRIAQYMNESAVAIATPCGHCDNCGITRVVDQAPATLDKQLKRRVDDFNGRFDALVDRPNDTEAVQALLVFARSAGLMGAVRDRAARHLERAPHDLAPRLAAAVAGQELSEPRSAERHVRALVETAQRVMTTREVMTLITSLPRALVLSIARDFDGLFAHLETAQRDLMRYHIQYICRDAGATDTLLTIVRRAAGPFARPKTTEEGDHAG